ncbi:hypothetical protein BY996DRAFT_6419426 [Phakopsora pachyrhizi]|uniref:Nascent polypeptide-associated complex subunit alpha-like UBA domain-containing protein n=1 Tax=Phakopsora pachyrhizi TaxID=170000 RepID=A0AAV0BW75_PHAPC|nr:hypothetical protein BY996DRAFT_6419426 [Phakopsora pachyrhizi]CAH7689856.1 hypothetical protein PPACK8108_LOCUS25014 [Phakopsora pachyrhizi]
MPAPGQRTAHVPGAKVISYYTDADGQFGTIRVGYDVDLFDEAVQNIVYGPLRKVKDNAEDGTLIKDGKDEGGGTVEEASVQTPDEHPSNVKSDTKAKEGTIDIKKEDVQLICTQLEVNSKRAENALKLSNGSLEDALLLLIHDKDLDL